MFLVVLGCPVGFSSVQVDSVVTGCNLICVFDRFLFV